MRTCSLARKFFEDFPEATELPLLLPADQQGALEQYVRPLLNLEDTSTAGCCDAVKQLLPVFSAAGGLETYRSARAAADYVQSPLVSVSAQRVWPHPRMMLSCGPTNPQLLNTVLTHLTQALSISAITRRLCSPQLLTAALTHHMQALCILDTAAAFSLLPGAAALAEQERDAFDELLAEDLRRRLVANKLDKLDGSTAAAAGSVSVLLDQHPAVKAATPAAGEKN